MDVAKRRRLLKGPSRSEEATTAKPKKKPVHLAVCSYVYWAWKSSMIVFPFGVKWIERSRLSVPSV